MLYAFQYTYVGSSADILFEYDSIAVTEGGDSAELCAVIRLQAGGLATNITVTLATQDGNYTSMLNVSLLTILRCMYVYTQM